MSGPFPLLILDFFCERFTAGEGWYQEEGKEAVSLQEGSVVNIPTEVKHWGGVKADS